MSAQDDGDAADVWEDGQPSLPTWTTSEGLVIPFEEMSDDHLTNAVRYLRRQAGEVSPRYSGLIKEAEKRSLPVAKEAH